MHLETGGQVLLRNSPGHSKTVFTHPEPILI